MLTSHVGNETQVVLEFSPYQKVPAEKSKPDNRVATIEEGISHDIPTPAALFTQTQTMIICHSSSRWRTTIRNHLMKKHSNI